MPASPPSVLISGMGLMGSSLAGALTDAGWPVFLHHYKQQTAQRAEDLGLGQAVRQLEDAASVHLAVVCTPVSVIEPTVRAVAQACPSAVITDVGSTKGELARSLADVQRYVGSHPMCGSHATGLDHGDPALYQGRLTITTPLPTTDAANLGLVEAMWMAAGSRILRLDPDRHDVVVAEASHLPHLMAVATAMLLSEAAAPVCAGGFRDTTRIAGASPDLWVDILASNTPAIRERLAAARAALAELDDALAHGNSVAIRDWLQRGRDGRLRFEQAQK
jgi:prephenate dehydrogenase